MTSKTISASALLISAALAVSCASAPKPKSEVLLASAVKQARFVTKLRVKDLKTEKTHNVTADLIGERGGSMRLEITAIMGQPVASCVLSTDFRCALYMERKFYESPLGDRALQPALKVPLSPVILRQLAFDEGLPASQWKCSNKGSPFEVCESAASKTKISWNREGAARKIRIESPGFDMEWAFGPPRTDVQLEEKTFRLEAPKGFKVIRL